MNLGTDLILNHSKLRCFFAQKSNVRLEFCLTFLYFGSTKRSHLNLLLIMTALEFTYNLDQVSKTLRPFALRLTRDTEDANDLLQDTMLKAFTNRDKYTDGTNLKAWLYTIMKNTFITNYQRMVRRKTFIDTTDNLHYINTADNSTDNQAYSTFALEDINCAIESLDTAYKTPFMMHFRGFKYHEIADKLEIPIGTVKNRIHIARKDLKRMLQMYSRLD